MHQHSNNNINEPTNIYNALVSLLRQIPWAIKDDVKSSLKGIYYAPFHKM